MTLADFVKVMAEKLKVSDRAAREMLDMVTNTIVDSLKKGEEVKLPGIGLFKVKEAAARKARNPKTGEIVKVPAKKKLAFKASASIKKELV